MKRILRYIKRKTLRGMLWMQYFFSREVCDIDPDGARKELQAFSPMPTSSAITEYREFGNDFDLSIIVPAYNAEKWIRECMDSIVNQKTSYSLQILVVNDGSTDHTGEILSEYENDRRVTIITQQNKGYSGARNVAIAKVRSEYLMFVDSDDYVLPNSIQVLMDTARKHNADIVEGNGYTFNECGRIGKIKAENKYLWGGPCLKVMKSLLFSRVEFPEGFLYEDTIVCALIKPLANQILMIPDEVYAYRIHENSITQKKDDNPKRLDTLWIFQRMIEDQKSLRINNYDWIPGHIVISERRLLPFPLEFQANAFIAFREIVSTLPKIEYDTSVHKRLMEAIIQRSFEKYRILCKLI